MAAIKVEKATPERLKELGIDSWSAWECGVETFDWEYSSDETAYVQEGQVKVKTVTDLGKGIETGRIPGKVNGHTVAFDYIAVA